MTRNGAVDNHGPFLQAGRMQADDDQEPVRHVMVLGGGSAGWLTAALIAADHAAATPGGLRVTLLESPEVKTIGVGEGTWPTLRDTLARIGVGEAEFVRACDATFKQGSRFEGWVDGSARDGYDHPFSLPHGHLDADLVHAWTTAHAQVPFAHLVTPQAALCHAGRAPKQFTTPEYAAVANYAYHLDAGKLGVFLQEHATRALGVEHVRDHVVAVERADNGDIAGVRTRARGLLGADLFVDCTGMRALLIGEHCGQAVVPCHDTLFNDRALALQVPHASDEAPIASQTVSTAQRAGWIWDIGLSSRRGVGHVYSSAHTSDDEAESALLAHIRATGGDPGKALGPPARIRIEPGYRRTPWHRNCVAVGLSSGFVEPLEASSLVLVELAAAMISDQLPATRSAMDTVAARFNETFAYRWERVVEFLKLHYLLSRRDDSDYWRDHRRDATVPDHLRELLSLWRHQPPSRYDFGRVEEVFPSASWQYILYGMGFVPAARATARRSDDTRRAEACFAETAQATRNMLAGLPGHRALVDHIRAHGLPTHRPRA